VSQLSDYQDSDPYKPAIVKDPLHQYDNYQIYSLYCLDRQRVTVSDGVSSDSTIEFTAWLAVQSYSPYRVIPCNFSQIAGVYK
jgi:hypothetical protein